MKVIILLITVSFLFSCGKKSPKRPFNRYQVQSCTPNRYPPIYTLDYKCSKASGGGQTIFNCFNKVENCRLKYGKYLNTYICTPRLEEE